MVDRDRCCTCRNPRHVFLLSMLVMQKSISAGCTILFKFHGSQLREESFYWSGVGFATHGSCELECYMDDLCAAVVFNSETGECRKSTSTAPKNANSCPECSFSHKQCGTGKYLLLSVGRKVNPLLVGTLHAIGNKHLYLGL